MLGTFFYIQLVLRAVVFCIEQQKEANNDKNLTEAVHFKV